MQRTPTRTSADLIAGHCAQRLDRPIQKEGSADHREMRRGPIADRIEARAPLRIGGADEAPRCSSTVIRSVISTLKLSRCVTGTLLSGR